MGIHTRRRRPLHTHPRPHPHPRLHPPLPLTTPGHRPVCLAAQVPPVIGIGTPQWRSKCPSLGRRRLLPDGFPVALTKNPRRLRNHGKWHTLRAIFVESARYGVCSRLRTVRTGRAGEFPFPRPFHSFLLSGISPLFHPNFRACVNRDMGCEYPTESRRGTHRTSSSTTS